MPHQLIVLIPLVHAAATWCMTGLIWFVQVVHYPLMGQVSSQEFPAYARAHQQRTTWVVAPLMLLEGSSTLAMFWLPSGEITATPMRWIALALLILIWISTFAVQVPLHQRLVLGFEQAIWRRLVTTNWVRTIAWTLRAMIALIFLQST